MSQRVQAYKSKSGAIYATEAEADACDLRGTLRQIITEKAANPQRADPDWMISQVIDNAHRLWADLSQYCKSHPVPPGMAPLKAQQNG